MAEKHNIGICAVALATFGAGLAITFYGNKLKMDNYLSDLQTMVVATADANRDEVLERPEIEELVMNSGFLLPVPEGRYRIDVAKIRGSFIDEEDSYITIGLGREEAERYLTHHGKRLPIRER